MITVVCHISAFGKACSESQGSSENMLPRVIFVEGNAISDAHCQVRALQILCGIRDSITDPMSLHKVRSYVDSSSKDVVTCVIYFKSISLPPELVKDVQIFFGINKLNPRSSVIYKARWRSKDTLPELFFTWR